MSHFRIACAQTAITATSPSYTLSLSHGQIVNCNLGVSVSYAGNSVDLRNMLFAKFNNAIQHSTISLTTIKSGVGDPPKVNVIPSVAEATIDCRVLPGTTKEQWLAEIRRRLGDPDIKIDVVYESEDPIVTTQDSTFYRALESAVKRRHPDAIVTPMVVPYGTDANSFRPKGVKSYGFTPVIVPAEAAMSMHGDAEYLPVDAVAPAIQILFEALKETVSK